MSNVIKLKHGTRAPTTSDLQEYEIGYYDKALYIREQDDIVKINEKSEAESVLYLYNGMKLGKLPDWDKITYPYAVIEGYKEEYLEINEYSSQYSLRLFASKEPLCVRKSELSSTDTSLYLYNLKEALYWQSSSTKAFSEWQNSGTYSMENRSIWYGGNSKYDQVRFMWSNHDVINTEDNTIWCKASEPTPVDNIAVLYTPQILTEPQKAVARENINVEVAPEVIAHLYNNVELPILPEWDKTAYPYATIILEQSALQYQLYISNYPFNARNGNTLASGKNGIYYCLSTLDSNTWGEFSEIKTLAAGKFISGAVNFIWANYYVYYQDYGTITNNIHLAATDPVPVYRSNTAVLYAPQILTKEQKAQARANIGINTSEVAFCLYNDIELPVLPEWNKDMYPIAIIIPGSPFGTSKYQIQLGSALKYRTLENGNYQYGLKNNHYYANLSADGKSWHDLQYYKRSEDSYIETLDDTVYTIWTNTDVINKDGTIYLAASNPIPIGSKNSVIFYTEQILTDEQKAQARKNIGITGTGGYTPIKGVDYYTEEDKQEIIAIILEEIKNSQATSEIFSSNIKYASGFILNDSELNSENYTENVNFATGFILNDADMISGDYKEVE